MCMPGTLALPSKVYQLVAMHWLQVVLGLNELCMVLLPGGCLVSHYTWTTCM